MLPIWNALIRRAHARLEHPARLGKKTMVAKLSENRHSIIPALFAGPMGSSVYVIDNDDGVDCFVLRAWVPRGG